MSNFDLLDSNLMLILQTMANSQSFCQYLYYDVETPTIQPTLPDPSVLLLNKMFPMPFDETITTTDCSELHVYYLSGNLENNMVVTEDLVIFDIVVAKSLWLIHNSDGTPAIRPYRIMNEIVKQFRDKSVGTVGKLLFKNFRHFGINKQFDGIRLTAKMTGFSGV